MVQASTWTHVQQAQAFVNQGVSCCLCRFPGGAARLYVQREAAPAEEAFIVQPWKGEALYLYPFSANAAMPGPHPAPAPVALPVATAYEAYAGQFRALQGAFRQNGLRKAVLSRVKRVPRPASFSLAHYFGRLEEAYPEALVYALYLPGHGLWMGASPEVLLQGSKGHWRTHSLAGTRPRQSAGPYSWSAKEEEEQQLVSDHIVDVLRSAGLSSWHSEGPYTVEAGSVAHLRTLFSFHMHHGMEHLLQSLHPTPAVAGLPVPEAVQHITALEQHGRGLYTGYLGRAAFPERASLYVNLRCMQVGTHELALYVGGGITAGSKLEDEWAETEHKALTLLKLLDGYKG